MSLLLTKRLGRSLLRTKLRLAAVIFMVAIGVFAGISFGSYANTATNLYSEIYDGQDGVNLPDIWIENPSGIWNNSTADSLCNSVLTNVENKNLDLRNCETRLILNGILFHEIDGKEKAISSVWHGIGLGEVDKVWMPKDTELSSGVIAKSNSEIVLDSHIAIDIGVSVGDVIELSSGFGRFNYTVVGIGFHSQHLFFAQDGATLPADNASFAAGYLTIDGLTRLANLSDNSANMILIDVEGTPSYDLQSTNEIDEGEELNLLIDEITQIVADVDNAPMSIYDRSGVFSVEVLRADAEGAAKMFPFVTGMIASIAGITIFLSLQRLIQSQAREIAVMRTLGVPKKSIIPGYVIAPLVIGFIGSVIGSIMGVFIGAPGMLGFYEEMIGLPIDKTVDYSLLIQINSISLAIVLLAGIRPAWQASNLQPLKIFRGQHEIKVSSRRMQRLTANLPTTLGLSIRSTLRKPMRIGFTFFAVGISMLLFGSMLFMMNSMEENIIGGLEEKQTWDLQAYIPNGGEENLVQWAEESGSEHELLLNYPLGLIDDNREMLGFGIDHFSTIKDPSSMILVDLYEGDLPQKNQIIPEVLIDQGTSKFLDWNIGDVVSIEVGFNDYEVNIVGITEGEITRTMYFHRADLTQLVEVESTSILIQFGTNNSLDGLAEISTGYVLKQDSLDTFDKLLEQQQQVFYAIEFLGIIIAIAVLFNTLLMNLAERDTELATLRVLGAPMNKIGKMMFWEHLSIGLIGGILGSLFAYFGTVLLISSMVQWAFYFTISPDMNSIMIITFVIVSISVALTPIGMRRIKKMDLVEKVKDLSN